MRLPWCIRTDMLPAEDVKRVQEFLDGVRLVEDAVSRIPGGAWHFRPAPGKWTLHEILIHLADAEAVGYARVRRMIAEPGSTIFAYDQDAWTASLQYESTPAEDALALFSICRKLTAGLLLNLEAGDLSRHVLHPERGPITVSDYVGIYTRHVDDHLKQIQRNLEAWKP